MALHKGVGNDRRLAVSPFLAEADPLGPMELAPPLHRLADGPVAAETAYRLIHDELMLDGNAKLDLATFVTTSMEDQATRLMTECLDRNMIDKDEYPQTAELERRFLRLGRDGFRAVQQSCRNVARFLADSIEGLGHFRLLTRGDELPVFAFTTKENEPFDVFDVSRRLRERGWQVPAYSFPENREDLSVLRIVCRNGFSLDLAELLLADLNRLLPELLSQPQPLQELGIPAMTAFHH